jgi:uncharacterized phage protein (TIGR02216 family)
MIGFGLGLLRLSSHAFWQLTPRELACAIEAVSPPAVAAIDRTDFERLMGAFPDPRR